MSISYEQAVEYGYICGDCGAAHDHPHSLLCPAHGEQLLAQVLCAALGHTWDDESAIGPDSGIEAHTCSRCGESWSHTWY